MLERLQNARTLLKEKNLDALLFFKPQNRLYISGFTGTTGHVLITESEALFITDFRYVEQAKNQCTGFEVIEIGVQKSLTDVLKEINIKTVGVEEDFLTFGMYNDFNSKLENLRLVPLEGSITKQRSIKSQWEIALIEIAASITDEAFQHILDFIKPGMTESEVALELEFFMKRKGASGLSFDIIVASGTRGSLPHGVASEKIIRRGDMITIDFGCIYKGYCSDMTRTFILGKASENQKKIYNIVLDAQQKSLQEVKQGITGKELDQIARDIIESYGYGKYFGHGLGHGVGLEVHELPHVNMLGIVPMQAGMVITIEPGIYVPDLGGVRIEDLVVVTETGYRVLSKSTKELIEL